MARPLLPVNGRISTSPTKLIECGSSLPLSPDERFAVKTSTANERTGHIVSELLTTERTYVRDLSQIINGYLDRFVVLGCSKYHMMAY